MIYKLEFNKAQVDAIAEAVKEQAEEFDRIGSPDSAQWWRDIWSSIHDQAAEQEEQ